MSAAIVAAGAAVLGLGLAYEQNRNARAAQREQKTKIQNEENRINAELDFERKKKGEIDIANSRAALRLRGGGTSAAMSGGMNGLGLGAPLSNTMSDKLGL